MKRRSFLAGAAAGGAISMLDWLTWFRTYGVPGTQKSLGLAEAAAQDAGQEPKFLIYWFQEGGWDSYCMFSPVVTPNHGNASYAAGTLNPTPSWSNQFYRPKDYAVLGDHYTAKMTGNVQHGFLAEDGASLINDMAVVSSHYGNPFHSGGRWEYQYGKYQNYAALSAVRGANERSVLHAFCERYGASLPMAHVSWHRWLSDGELSEPSYPEGTGYYEKLGPAYAHTTYGKTPVEMRNRLSSLSGVVAGARTVRIRQFVDNLNANFLSGKDSESVRAFDSALKVHKQLTATGGVTVNPQTMFTDPTLRGEFNVTAADEATTATSVNGNPARSKDSPNTNVQAMMTYELMTKGLSNGFWIENRQIRGFDSHRDRTGVLSNKGQTDQLSNMRSNLWTPLKALVNRLKTTPYGAGGKSFWDLTTIVICSEMGRTIQGDVASILAKTIPDADKYKEIMDQDVCQHWRVSSVAFLGGTVKGGTQWGRVGTVSLEGIPVMPDGTLDPAYDATTGVLIAGRTKSPNSVVSDAGHVYSTALELSGIPKVEQKGLNAIAKAPMSFLKK